MHEWSWVSWIFLSSFFPHDSTNKLSHNCLLQDLYQRACECLVFLWSCVLSCELSLSHAWSYDSEIKETLLQVKERLTREQATRTRNRIKELLDRKDIGSDSDSEEEHNSSTNEIEDSLSELRRDLYLGLLCLWALILLLTYWIHNIGLRSCN